MPKLPQRLSDIVLDGEWTETLDGRDFLLANDGDEKILVFGTEEYLKKLSQADVLFMDGTFYTAPSMFCQLYTIHGLWHGQMIPLVYVLLPNKTRETYTRMFRLLQDALIARNIIWSPNSFQIDFELAVIRAIEMLFPNAQIRGCLFHFCQSIWRKVQELGLVIPYREDSSVQRLIKR